MTLSHAQGTPDVTTMTIFRQLAMKTRAATS